ncbi:MAG: outer membrane protein assembly factor BamD [Ignavibacteria bacterium]|jgi:outer membrane protein assembly factor BamD|nr:outer membrane protein assembly factor BamD [Ignavibacteria bacterium]MCU7502649.1 outer membrane protein assembly factor BamD [Ignavibacteria bacterium]MCU7515148.1 outer membrane protein assembly factor BamD [Ignavibacteria bacterium]
MKKFLALVILSVALWGCSSTVNTTNMTADEHLNYAMKLFNDGDYMESINEFQALLLQYPGSAVADQAQYYLAESHYKRDEYILAAYEYSRLIKDIPASKLVPQAQFMLAESYYQLSPYYQLDQRYTNKSIEEFQAFIDFFPTDPRVPEAEQKIKELNNKLAEKEFHTAEIYEKMENYDAAIYYYNIVTDTYHDSKFAATAQYNKIRTLIQIKENKTALKEIASFLQRYPSDGNVAAVKKLQESLSKNG